MIWSVVNSHLPLWQGYYKFAHQKTERGVMLQHGTTETLKSFQWGLLNSI